MFLGKMDVVFFSARGKSLGMSYRKTAHENRIIESTTRIERKIILFILYNSLLRFLARATILILGIHRK
jgi:hypothetical protein